MALTTDGDAQVLPHIQRMYNLSECRSPMIVCVENGDPLKSIETLAKTVGSAVWTMSMDSPKNEQNALDYLEVGLANGDWLFLAQCEKASPKVLREISLQLLTISPDPKAAPRRSNFRLWLLVQKPVDINDNINPVFPAILTQNCLFGMRDPTTNKVKVIAKNKVDPTLSEEQLGKKQARVERGQDPDDESDQEEEDPGKKVTGMWFHRSVDFYSADAENQVTRNVEDIFDSIEKGEVDKVKEIIQSNTVDLNAVTKAGLTPLLWAIMCDNTAMVRQLLEAEADPNLCRAGTGMPPIFMPIEDPDMLQLLINFGADIDARFEGKTLADHPDTAPAIQDFLKQYLH
eukprot:NODE_1973_length_1169_cov_127.354127_g1956_i0.p1 GENE.NODE_1973_length_1169_cov_127.354127_g1956_i0~~NODE_1973_length_1169_cov_127.354127_g1956_i0.p1  ORF type:complete len:345 (+),score=80.43 NODE_1973_length_1169_cov_127.354127_g1956_i0:76-1110(+)